MLLTGLLLVSPREKNALAGDQFMKSDAASQAKLAGDDGLDVDVVVIGAGPIGLEVAVGLKEAGINYRHFDANQIGHTMTWWPRNTHFFSTTERLAIAGVPIQNNHQQRITGEDYLAYLRSVVEQFDLRIDSYEPVTRLVRTATGFVLESESQHGRRVTSCRQVVMAIGDMHWANQLRIPGEDLPHVSHYFRDPHDYFRKRLLVVGGKNSAVEAALRCWRAGSRVTMSYRREQFDPAAGQALAAARPRSSVRRRYDWLPARRLYRLKSRPTLSGFSLLMAQASRVANSCAMQPTLSCWQPAFAVTRVFWPWRA